jgi:Flp pilus assembly protein TadB
VGAAIRAFEKVKRAEIAEGRSVALRRRQENENREREKRGRGWLSEINEFAQPRTLSREETLKRWLRRVVGKRWGLFRLFPLGCCFGLLFWFLCAYFFFCLQVFWFFVPFTEGR